MAKKRRQNWPRGTPRPVTDPQSINPDVSGTADLDFTGARTVDATWEPTPSSDATFAPITEPRTPRRPLQFSAGWVSAIIAGLGALGVGFTYVAAIKTDVAVVSTRVDALQKSHDGTATNLRDEIRRVENGLELKLSRLLELLSGRREPETSTRKPARSQ